MHDHLDFLLFKSVEEDTAHRSLKNLLVNEATLKRYAEEISEPMIVPDLLGKSVKASPLQFPKIYEVAEQICSIINIEVPDIYIYEGYAYLIDSNGLSSPRLEVSARLIRDFEELELTHCFAKELMHIKLGHIETEVLVERMAEAIHCMGSLPVISTLKLIGGPQVLSMILRAKAFKWFREAVFTAENFATAYTADVGASIRSTLLQVFNNREVVHQIDVASFCDQVGAIEMIEGSAAVYTKLDEVIPYTPYRITNILQYASSQRGIELRTVLAGAKSEIGLNQ